MYKATLVITENSRARDIDTVKQLHRDTYIGIPRAGEPIIHQENSTGLQKGVQFRIYSFFLYLQEHRKIQLLIESRERQRL